MTLGFLLALAAGFVWSITNVIDKVLLDKLIRSPIFQTLIFAITSLIIGLIALPFAVNSVQGWDWILMFGMGFTFILGTWLYFIALQREEPSRVIPLFSLAVVFLVPLSAFFLDELFTLVNYIGIGSIIIGSFIISSRKDILSAFRSRLLGVMVLSALSYAVSFMLIKYLLNQYSFWTVFAYQRVFIGLLGILILIFFLPRLRTVFYRIKRKHLMVSFLGEVIGEGGTFLFIAATAVWYVTLVEAVVSVQYVFIFFWALIISRFKPSLFSEEINKKVMLQKIVSIALIIVGIYLIT